MKRRDLVATVAMIAALVSLVVVGLMSWQLQGQREGLKKLEEIILDREPKVEYLEPFVQQIKDLYRITVPIRNSSGSRVAVAHRVRVAFEFFYEDNSIVEFDPQFYRVIDGGEGHESVTFEVKYLYPLSVLYMSVLVRKKEIPRISISWAEQKS